MTKPIEFEVAFDCINKDYKVVARAFTFRQFRLQLLRKHFATGQFEIVREMCTYELMTAITMRDGICSCTRPEEYMESFARPWNCEVKGGRIRLDNKPEEVVGPWEPWLSKRKAE